MSGKESSFSDTVTAESTTDQDAVNLSKNGNEASGLLLFLFFVLKHDLNFLSSQYTRPGNSQNQKIWRF